MKCSVPILGSLCCRKPYIGSPCIIEKVPKASSAKRLFQTTKSFITQKRFEVQCQYRSNFCSPSRPLHCAGVVWTSQFISWISLQQEFKSVCSLLLLNYCTDVILGLCLRSSWSLLETLEREGLLLMLSLLLTLFHRGTQHSIHPLEQ